MNSGSIAYRLTILRIAALTLFASLGPTIPNTL